MMTSPKQRFTEDKTAFAQHNELTVNGPFLRACDAALLQMLHQAARPTDNPSAALAGFNRMTGAVEFLRHLLTLTEKPTVQSKPTDFNLNHKA